jgi:hypothetical protein
MSFPLVMFGFVHFEASEPLLSERAARFSGRDDSRVDDMS